MYMSIVNANPTLKLIVNVKKDRKKGTYHYQVVNRETGEVMADRFSERVYVACTKDCGRFFGRVDLALSDRNKNAQYFKTPEDLASYYVFMEEPHPGYPTA
jgi:hypothetical protein